MIKIFKKNIKETIILTLLSSFFVLASTVGALLIAKSIDFLLKQNFYQFLYYILLSFIAWISGLFSNYIRRIKEETLTQKICTDLRSAAIKKLVSEFSSNSKQDKFVNYDEYVNLCTNDIEIISDGIGCFFELVSILSGVIFSSLALFSFHYIIVLTSILLGLIILVIPKFFDDKISDGINNVSEKYKELQSNSFNMINGSHILNNYSSLKLMLGVIKNHSISLGNDKITLEKNLSKLWILINFLNTFSQVLLIFISGWLAYNKIVSYGIIISVGNLSNQLFNSLQSFGEVYSKYILSKSILRKYDLDLQVKKVDKSEMIFSDKIITSNLSYSYNNKEKINFPDICIKKNGKYIIIGESGTGKTTILDLLAKLYKVNNGSIYIGDKNIDSLSKESVRNNISYIQQNPVIFNDTIFNNFRFVKNNITKEEVLRIISLVGLSKMIKTLPRGLNTLIGNNGHAFSGGERQRIAIGIALAKKSKLLLLDEITSDLDGKAEGNIIDIIKDVSKYCTVIMIAHRINSIKNIDNIYVLKEGFILAKGTHEELLKKCGYYSSLVGKYK